jgi:ABC-2 type transport system ATP-binding protein
VSSSEYAISTSDLSKHYGETTKIGPISLRVNHKSIFGFLGPNGAGKTTTIRMILGLVKPTTGSVRILSEDPHRDPSRALKQVGYAPELPNFQTFFTGEDLLYFTAKLHGMSTSDRRRRINELIEMVGLGYHSKKKIGKYSKGMIQRLSVAQALMNDPQLIIMDEPTLGMDPAATIHFRDLFKSLSSEGRTILISSHQLDEIQRIASDIGMIHKGRMVLQGTTSQVLDTFSKEKSIKVELEKIDVEILKRIDNLDYVSEVKQSSNSISVTFNESKDLRADLVEDIIKIGGRIRELSLQETTLEEAFIETLKREKN